jgi:hypothetical protein
MLASENICYDLIGVFAAGNLETERKAHLFSLLRAYAKFNSRLGKVPRQRVRRTFPAPNLEFRDMRLEHIPKLNLWLGKSQR